MAGRFIERLDASQKWAAREWCRPILPDGIGHDAIPTDACDRFNPLDVVSIELEEHIPNDGQPENWRWAASSPIVLERTFNNSSNAIANLTESPADLWHDPLAGRQDEVGQSIAISSSLYLIQATDLWLQLSYDPDGRKRIVAEFVYGGRRYEHFAVTDPIILRILSRQFPEVGGTARMQLYHGDSYWLTVSLGLPFGPRHARYKFVAAVIDHTGYLQRTYR